MDSILSLLKDTPIPTILVVSGVVFLFLALAGQVAGKLEVPPARQKWAAAAGAIFLAAGLLLYLAPGLARGSQAEISTSQLGADTVQPASLSGAAQIDQAMDSQDFQDAQGALASPVLSGAAGASAAEGVEGCLSALFSGIEADRVVRVESGTANKDLLSIQQKKDAPAAIVLLELGQPVMALTYYFIEDDELFKLGSVVDAACQPVEYANESRGGDRNVLQNWDTLKVTSGTTVYFLRFGYSGGVVALGTSKYQE